MCVVKREGFLIFIVINSNEDTFFPQRGVKTPTRISVLCTRTDGPFVSRAATAGTTVVYDAILLTSVGDFGKRVVRYGLFNCLRDDYT